MKLSLLFKKENLKYIELEKELSKNELIMNVVDYGIINKNSIVDFYNKDENIQLHCRLWEQKIFVLWKN